MSARDVISRRQLIVRLGGAAGGAAFAPLAAGETARPETSKGSRDPTDPDLVNPELLWPKLLGQEERATLAAVCDVILPADERSPAASQVGVPDFIDEWVSAPYPHQMEDRQIVRGGLAWLNTEASKRFGKPFRALSLAQMSTICDDIAHGEESDRTAPRFRAGGRFFRRVRHLTMLGFYTTVEGMKDLGYVGNVALTEWKGPPDEVLQRLGLVAKKSE